MKVNVGPLSPIDPKDVLRDAAKMDLKSYKTRQD